MYRRAVLVCLLAISTVIASVAVSPEVFANNTKGARTSVKPDVFTPGRINRATTAPSKAPATQSARKQEMVAWRTRFSRTFATQNGYETDVTAGSVNYQDASGQWQPIDDTLVASHAAGYALQNKANRYVALFPSDLARNPVHVSTPAGSVDFALVGGTGAPTASQQTASYPSALPSVQLTFETQADTLKENLILKDRTASTSFRYSLRTSSGLTARANPAGGIDFVDAANRVQFSFAAPFMFDASGTPSGLSRAVTIQLADSAAGQTVTITADSTWLQSSSRQFPVTIDPTVVWTNVNYYGGQDCFIQNTSPTSNFCSSGPYTGGNTDLVGYNGSSVNRALFEFPIQTGYTHIVPNSNILDADLTLTLASSSSTGSVPVGIYPVTSSWNDNYTTWNNRDNATAWATPGGDFGATVLDTENVGPTAGTYKWHSLTQTIQNWVNGTSTNNGFLLRVSNEGASGLLQFYNQLYGTSGTDPSRPHLRVQWNNWLGEQPWFKFEGHTLTDRMSLNVNVANGNLVVRSSDLAIKGTGLDLQVDRYYGSLSADTWHIGHGWNLNVGCDVRLDTDDWDGLSYHEPDGYAVLFRSNGSGGYTLPAGFDADLTHNPDGTYTMKWRANGFKLNFQSGGCLQNMVDANGNSISMGYNGSLQSITDTQGRLTSFVYGSPVSSDLVTQIKDPAGRVLNYSYDSSSNLTAYTDAANQVTKYAYNANQQLSQITDPNGNVVNFSFGTVYPYPVTQIQYVSSSCPGGACTDSFTYNSGNTVVTDANGNRTTYYLDNQGRATSVVDALGNNPSLAYTADNNVQAYKDAVGATSSYTWDASNNLKSLQMPTGAGAAMTYGDASHPYYPTTYKDAQGNSTGYAYDANGNATLVTDSLAIQNQFKATYNANGTPASTTDPMGNVTSYSYDTAGNLTGMTRPVPLGAISISYDGLSRRTSITDGKGQKTTIGYDSLDRVTSLAYADGSTITYAYDSDGNLASITDNTGTTSFTYDALNQMTKKTLPGGGTITYAYDPVGNLTSTADAGGTVTYGYNAVNLPVSLTEPSSAKTTFAYDANYHRTSTVFPNGVTMSMAYDASGRLTSIVGKNGSGAILTSFTYSFTNPATGFDSDLRSSVTDASGNKTAYTYDVMNRLSEAKTTNNVGSVTADYQYAYDGNGNRVSQSINGSQTNYSYNAANELTSAGGTTYNYDANGNETGYASGLSFAYNAKDQTSSITPSGGAAINMAYTGALQSQRTAAGSANFTYSELGLTIGAQPTGTSYYTRDPEGALVEERTPTGNYYYLVDGLGSTVALVDANGNVAATYKYDPYGQLTSSTGSVSNPWLFAGTYYDSSTKLYKMGARYYDPSLGRFTQEDPMPSSENLYTYVSDNPVNFTDPSGLFIPLLIAAGIIVGAAAGAYIGHWWAQSHHYNTAGTIAMTAGGAVVGGVAGYYAAEGVLAGTAGRGLGFGGYRIAIHLAHKAFPQTFRGGVVRTARWLWKHPEFRTHIHWEWRGIRYPR